MRRSIILMRFEKLDLDKHDSLKVSELIYEADMDTFNVFFQNKASAAEKIEKLVIAGGNTLGYENIHVVSSDDNHVLGILVSFRGDEIDKREELKVIFKNFNLYDSLKFIVIDLIDRLFHADLGPDDYYLAVIAVDEEFRGKGIGTCILKNGLKLARAKGFKRVVLDVDIDNERALRLYDRFGFKVFKKKSIPWFGGEVGAFNMEY